MTDHTLPSDGFIPTKEYLRFVEFCDACRQDRYIGICYGAPGVGKTLSADHYTAWSQVELWSAPGSEYPPTDAILATLAACRSVFYTTPVNNSASTIWTQILARQHRLNAIVDRAHHMLHGTRAPRWPPKTMMELIVIDEADRLKPASLDQLRDIYDQQNIGLILIGMPGLERRLARYDQLTSRVGFVHQFRLLPSEDMRQIITTNAHLWKRHGSRADQIEPDAISSIIRMTGGNFRVMTRLFAQIDRILTINTLQTITKDVVEAARETLVIGLH